jgi:hypothetical protein
MPLILAPGGYARWLGDEPDPRGAADPLRVGDVARMSQTTMNIAAITGPSTMPWPLAARAQPMNVPRVGISRVMSPDVVTPPISAEEQAGRHGHLGAVASEVQP